MNRTEAREKAAALVAKMTIEEAASQLLHSSPAIPRLGVPAYDWWSEALHGVARAGTATCYPQAIGLGATFDRDLLQKLPLPLHWKPGQNITHIPAWRTVPAIRV